MKQKRYTDEQIMGFLKAYEAGTRVTELIWEHGFSEQSFYRWKSKYSAMGKSAAKRLRELESENARLKKLLAETGPDKAMPRDAARKNTG